MEKEVIEDNKLAIVECIFCFDNIATRKRNNKWAYKDCPQKDFDKVKGVCPVCIKKDIMKESKSVYDNLVEDKSLPLTEKMLEVLKQRLDKGIKTYGSELRTYNGRNVLVDVVEEIADAVMYARQGLMQGEISQKTFNAIFAVFEIVLDEQDILRELR